MGGGRDSNVNACRHGEVSTRGGWKISRAAMPREHPRGAKYFILRRRGFDASWVICAGTENPSSRAARLFVDASYSVPLSAQSHENKHRVLIELLARPSSVSNRHLRHV